jgi:hypothetical protein
MSEIEKLRTFNVKAREAKSKFKAIREGKFKLTKPRHTIMVLRHASGEAVLLKF